jgi:Trk-type K+ transport system membrane component
VSRSLIVFATAIIVVIIASIILVTSLDSNGGAIPTATGQIGTYSINDILFEVCSAFGTTGLSTGLTHYLNTLSKLVLILVMFIGQLGVSSTLLV